MDWSKPPGRDSKWVGYTLMPDNALGDDEERTQLIGVLRKAIAE